MRRGVRRGSAQASRRRRGRIGARGFLAQGAIYPEAIESAGRKTGEAHAIKGHHHVGGLPAHLKLKPVEPLHEFSKDEVQRGS